MKYNDVREIVDLVEKRLPGFWCGFYFIEGAAESGLVFIHKLDGALAASVHWHPDRALNGVNSEQRIVAFDPFKNPPEFAINSVEGVVKCLVRLLEPPIAVLGEAPREYEPSPGQRPFAGTGECFFDERRGGTSVFEEPPCILLC